MLRLSMEDFIIAMPEKKIEAKQKQTNKQKTKNPGKDSNL